MPDDTIDKRRERPDAADFDRRQFVQTVGIYTADGTLISETRSVAIRIYKNGHWGSAGSLGQVTHHDRSNSKA
jgi:hypothetical protein